MEVTEQGELAIPDNKVPRWQLLPARFFSYLLHPLLLVGWITLFLLYLNPSTFLGADGQERLLVLLRVFSTSLFLPLVTVLLLKGLGFIDSIQLRTQKERIIPYVACITFFFWSYYVAKQLDDPGELRAFLLGLFVTAAVALYLNNYFKISMHTLGAGGMTALFVLLLLSGRLDSGFWMVVALLLAGLIGTSRLLTGSHRPFEIYAGYLTGFVVQVICWWIVF